MMQGEKNSYFVNFQLGERIATSKLCTKMKGIFQIKMKSAGRENNKKCREYIALQVF